MKKFITLILLLISINTQSQDTLTGKCWTPEMDTTEFYNFAATIFLLICHSTLLPLFNPLKACLCA